MSQLAERYSTALFEVLKDKNQIDNNVSVLVALKQSLKSNSEIIDLLNSPMISDTEKLSIVKNAIGNDLTKELETFFELLLKNNRLADLPMIVTKLEERVAEEQGVEKGIVRSATELSDDEKQRIQKIIENKLSKKVELQFNVESNMIGGIEAKVGSYIFEDSIKTHMQKLNDYITRRVQ